MLWIFAALAVLVGGLIPVQAGVNASLRPYVGHPLFAALTNFTVGGTILVVSILALRLPAPPLGEMGRAPWWCWVGGVMGAALVVSGVLFSHRLGAATFIACIILGQLSASVVVDHFGWVGFQAHPVNFWRLLGVGLLALGALLIRTH